MARVKYTAKRNPPRTANPSAEGHGTSEAGTSQSHQRAWRKRVSQGLNVLR